jgi:DNA polymerase-1
MKYSTKLQEALTPTLLIDADLFLFRASVIAEEETDWGDDIWSLATDLKVAKQIFTDQIKRFHERLGTTEALMCISSSENFRKDVSPLYKSNRKKSRKPVGYKAMVTWVEATWPSVTQKGLEADDVMGILGSDPNIDAVIVSDDKDMKTIPCRLYRPTDDDLIEVSEQAADLNFYTQTLQGDPTDGYSGCPKVGAVTAAKILGNRPDWSLVENQFIKSGLTREEAITQARLARILRFDDWDGENETIKLWSPSR